MIDFLTRANELAPEFIQHRRTLHAFAEIGFDLPNTTAYVCDVLTEYGYQPQTIGKAGIVCTIGPNTGKTILLRADMDALPMAEESGESFAAANGNCHSCGHDIHPAMLLGAAKLLKEHEDKLTGTVKLAFQPAEELLSGALDMVENGLLENPKVDAAFALHVETAKPYSKPGVLLYRNGSMANSGDCIHITVDGCAAHGSTPHLGTDAIYVAAQIVTALHHLPITEAPADTGVVVLVGKISGGDTVNTVPGKVMMEVSLRTPEQSIREKLIRRIGETARDIASAYGATATVEHIYGMPPLYNDNDLTDELVQLSTQLLGDASVQPVVKMSGTEDFTYIANTVPACLMFLGTGSSEQGYMHGLHHPAVRFAETAIPVGAAVLANAAYGWLAQHANC